MTSLSKPSSPQPSGSASPSAFGQGRGDSTLPAPQEQNPSPSADALGGFPSLASALPASTLPATPAPSSERSFETKMASVRRRAHEYEARKQTEIAQQQATDIEVAMLSSESNSGMPAGKAASSSPSTAPPSGKISTAPNEQVRIDENGRPTERLKVSHKQERSLSPVRGQSQNTPNDPITRPRPISELKLNSHQLKAKCAVQFGDLEVIGGLRPCPGYTIQTFLDGGLWGDPSLIIRFRTNKKGRALMPLDRELHRQKSFDLRVFAGLTANGDANAQDQVPFMLENFQLRFLCNVATLDTEQQLAWLCVEEKHKPSLVELSMFVNDHVLIGRVDDESWQQHGDAISRSLEMMNAKSYALRVWFHMPSIRLPWTECMMGPFLSAYEQREEHRGD